MQNEMNKTNNARPDRLPNKAFDSEYMTEWGREVRFLADKGIRYTYVKIKPEYGIRQYKYRKTPELFAALLEFYSQVANEKSYRKVDEMTAEAIALPSWVTQHHEVVTTKDMNALFMECDNNGGDN